MLVEALQSDIGIDRLKLVIERYPQVAPELVPNICTGSSWPRLALPAGKYVVEVSGQRVLVDLAEGAKFELKLN